LGVLDADQVGVEISSRVSMGNPSHAQDIGRTERPWQLGHRPSRELRVEVDVIPNIA